MVNAIYENNIFTIKQTQDKCSMMIYKVGTGTIYVVTIKKAHSHSRRSPTATNQLVNTNSAS